MTYEDLLERKRERLFGDHFPGAHLRGVEIGPLSRPLVLKAASEVYYVDHCSSDDLKKKYAGVAEAHAGSIVDVDFVWKGEPLATLVGDKAPLDYVVASHVIEHLPDLAGWLLDVEGSLKAQGKLYLIVPDKRFTFDVRRAVAKFEEIEAAKEEKRTRPGLRLVLDHFANAVQADAGALWNDPTLAERLPYCHGPEFLDLAHAHFHEGRYVDVHCWVFTPWSFLSILGEMTRRFGLGFVLKRFVTTQVNDLEFYVELEKSEGATDWEAAAAAAFRDALGPRSH